MKDVFEELETEVAQYVVYRKYDAIELKNLLIANDNLIAECLSQEVFCVATNSKLNVTRFTEMHVANTTAETRCLALEAELANLRKTNNHDNQKELINHFSKLEAQNDLFKAENDKIKHHYKELYDSIKITRAKHIEQAQNDLFKAENDKIKHHYKELYDSIKITRAKHIEQVTKLTTKNVNLKTCINKATVNPQVSARDKHDIDVEPIVPRLRNNRDAHLDYLRHLKESVETIHDIVEEAKVELLEYAIGTCPQGSQQRAKQLAYISLIRKKQVTIAKPSDKSDRVNSCPNASGSQPKSHVKANRISPVKGDNKLPVDDQPRKNKSHLRTSNHKMADVNAPSGQTPTMAPPRKHRFHPRPESSLHLSNEEPILGYLKFSAKGTKSEVFGMPIPNSLITAEIQQATYYQEYLKKETHHRKYLAGETRGVQNPPAPKPTQPARKPKAPTRPSISIPIASTQPAPTSAPAKSQENKRKQATETNDKPARAKRIKHSISRKTRQPRSSPKSVGASEAEEVPTEEPQDADEDADYQKALEESMKDAYALPKGSLPPVVIREPESGKYQPLLEVSGKGKAKVTEEQVSHDLLSLQKHKKTSPVDQYIFQRRVSEPTGSSGHDESPYALVGQSDNEEESKKVVLGVEESGQDKGQARRDPDAQAEDQTGSDAGTQAEGQAASNLDETSDGKAGSNPDETSKGQAGPDPGDAEAKVLSISSHVVYAGSDREHMDLDVADVSPQPSTEQLDEGFTATVYLNVQENLKLAVEEPVLLEEPASSSGTLSSLQHLSRDFSFGDQFFSDKHSDADKIPESSKEHQQLKATTTDTTTTTTTTLPPPQALQQSMIEAMMVKRIGELEHILADLIQVNKNIEERLDKHGARLYTLEQLDIPQQVSIAVSEVVTDAVDWAMQAPLRNHFRDLSEADMKEILHQRMWEFDSYKSHEDHMHLFEALEKSMNPGPSGASGAPRASGSAQMPPLPPLPSSTYQESPSKGSAAPSPSKTAASAEHQAWTTTDIRLRPSISLTPVDLEMDEDMAPDEQAQSSNDEDIGSTHIPMVNLRQGWWKPFEEERPTTPEPAWSIRSSDVPTGDIAKFIDWFCKRRGITEHKPQDLEGPAYEIVKVFHPNVIDLQYQMEECHKLLTDSVDDPILRHNVNKPLPLGGPPGQVTIQSDFFFNKDLEYLRYGSKGRRPALSISKMKAAYYSDAGLEQMVPDQSWIKEECKYDIAAMYGISHWWFQRQRFYIDRHTSEGDRSVVRTHMRILSVVRIEVFSMYGYDYMKKIVLCHADLNEHVIMERDFKYMYPSDFEDMYLLNLQGHLNHLPPKDKKILTMAVNQWTRQLVIRQRVQDFKLGIESYQTQVNLTKPQWTTMGFDDGTLLQIDEALDYRVKEFRINRLNLGLNTRFWTRKDVDRCNTFMFVIQRHLRTRRIFRNLESFVGGRVREGDYRLLRRID
nr:integrase, catalytic region, zinc finger, CCHC-type, peptidase aspartic, catalytic [Tanacetum cinerariifolium]